MNEALPSQGSIKDRVKSLQGKELVDLVVNKLHFPLADLRRMCTEFWNQRQGFVPQNLTPKMWLTSSLPMLEDPDFVTFLEDSTIRAEVLTWLDYNEVGTEPDFTIMHVETDVHDSVVHTIPGHVLPHGR